MGNKKGLIWYLTLFTDKDKKEVFKVIPCNSIKEMSYYLDMEPQVISNYYHKQIRPRGVLIYCNITQNHNI
jgi:hypothetical protein